MSVLSSSSSSSSSVPTFQDVSFFPDQIDSVLFDLGDVLFTWSASASEATLCPQTFKRILRSATWVEYEKGNLSEHEAYAHSAQTFGLEYADVERAFTTARASLRSDSVMFDLVRKLKQSGIRVYAMSNISAPDFEYLKSTVSDSEWRLFDRIFTSAQAHMHKPEICFFRHVLAETGIVPARSMFVDDKLENVLSACSVGMHGIIHSNRHDTIRQLSNMCLDPIQRAHAWLNSGHGHTPSVTSNGTVIDENFTQLLVMEAMGNKIPDTGAGQCSQINFFKGKGLLTTEIYPDDLDTTSIALTVKNMKPTTVHRVMDEMLSFLNNDGIVQVYFDHSRPRTDPVVCVNVLTLFHRYGRGEQMTNTMRWVEDVLRHRAYLLGTLYYVTPESFLFFLGRLMQSDTSIRQRLGELFLTRVSERFNIPGDSLALAMRILAAAAADESLALLRTPAAQADISRLRHLQDTDGSWTDGWFYRYGMSGILVKNDAVTTAFATRAIQISQCARQQIATS